jgi:hypothetical protein
MTARVMIGVPHRQGEVHIAFTRSLLQLDARGVDLGMIDHSHTDVAINRNVIVQKFLDHPGRATHLFFIDTDMGIPRDALQKLLAADKSIISGLAVEKVTNRIVAIDWGDGWAGSIPLQQKWCEPGRWTLKSEYRDRVLPIGATGAACLLIKREVFETIGYPWFFHEFDPNAKSHTAKSYMGEDISFFHKAKQHGIEAFMHTGVLCDHWLGTNKFPPSW